MTTKDTLKEQLLEERRRALAEVADIENLLVSRCGWVKDQPEKTEIVKEKAPPPPPVVNAVKQSATPIPTPSKAASGFQAGPIPYTKEAELWFQSMPPGDFIFEDYRKWLVAKYGEAEINDMSLRIPFRKLVASTGVPLVRQGVGRSPSIYRKA